MNTIVKAENFVVNLFKNKLPKLYNYHNLEHTKGVVNATKKIIKSYNLADSEQEMLLIAAWFHDTGYIEGSFNHEDKSISLATQFLSENAIDKEFIASVASIIEATKFHVLPVNDLQKIMKDADYYHFGSKDYFQTCTLLRKEWEEIDGKFYSDLEWMEGNLNMFTDCHQYYTPYAIENWQPQKEKNIALILNEINDLNMEKISKKQELKAAKKETKKADKTVDTMFKITITNHIRLSEIADSKANILLSVNAIIISIALSSLIPKLESPSNNHLILPTFTLILFSVLSIIFAILSTKPKVTTGSFTREDIAEKKVNLLFFGNFFKMPYEEFEWAMKEMMKDKEYLLSSMTKDLYYLGLVLERKYKLLRITYNIFMIGIVVSVVAFALAFKRF
jgi:predicted metal-dependent HD superfamily phosphohydrolase